MLWRNLLTQGNAIAHALHERCGAGLAERTHRPQQRGFAHAVQRVNAFVSLFFAKSLPGIFQRALDCLFHRLPRHVLGKAGRRQCFATDCGCRVTALQPKATGNLAGNGTTGYRAGAGQHGSGLAGFVRQLRLGFVRADFVFQKAEAGTVLAQIIGADGLHGLKHLISSHRAGSQRLGANPRRCGCHALRHQPLACRHRAAPCQRCRPHARHGHQRALCAHVENRYRVIDQRSKGVDYPVCLLDRLIGCAHFCRFLIVLDILGECRHILGRGAIANASLIGQPCRATHNTGPTLHHCQAGIVRRLAPTPFRRVAIRHGCGRRAPGDLLFLLANLAMDVRQYIGLVQVLAQIKGFFLGHGASKTKSPAGAGLD